MANSPLIAASPRVQLDASTHRVEYPKYRRNRAAEMRMLAGQIKKC